MTGPKPLPKRALHIVRSRASSFKWQHPLLSLRSSSSFLRLLPRLPVTSIPPFIFLSIARCRRQFLCKMWPIKLAFCLLISCRIFPYSLTLILLNFSHDRSNWSSPSFSNTTFQNVPGVSDPTVYGSLIGRDVKLTSHIGPRSRLCGAITTFSHTSQWSLIKHKGELTYNYGSILAVFLKVKARMEMVKSNTLIGYDDESTRTVR